MRTKAGLLIVVAVAVVLVWLLVRRDGSPPPRAEPARSTPERAASEPAPTAAPAEGDSGAKPTAAGSAVDAIEGVRIRVTASGQDVPDARVYILSEDVEHEPVKEESGTWFAGATGDLLVGATHTRYGPARKEVRAEKGKITEVALELPEGETLDILVVSEPEGRPVAGASIYVLRAGGPQLDGRNEALVDLFGDNQTDADISIFGALDVSDFMTLGGAPSVAVPKLTTGDDGRVRLTGLPPGTVDLIAAHPDHVPARLKNKPVWREAVARLTSGGSLTVLAPLVDGRAAEGYLCGAVRPGLMLSMPVGSAKVDEEGKAELAHLPPGPLNIVVMNARHPLELLGIAMGGTVVMAEKEKVEGAGEEERSQAEEDADGMPPAPKSLATGTVTIVAGQHKTLDLRDVKGARIEGVIVAREGLRKGAMVFLQTGDGYALQAGMQRTNEEGKFAFEDVPPGSYRVVVTADPGGVVRAELVVKEGDSVVKVSLELPVGAIVGRILGADGKPVKGRVLVTPRGGVAGQVTTLAELIEQFAGSGEADEEGNFRVPGVAPGAYRVLGGAGRRLDAVDVDVREGEEARVELRLDDARLRRLVVRLESAERKPVEGSVMMLGAEGGSAEMMILAENDDMVGRAKGSATHEFHLAPGRYRLIARAPGLAPALGEAVDLAADRDVTLTLWAGVRVELAFEGPDGPLPNRAVDVRNRFGMRLAGQTLLEMLLSGGMLRTDAGGVLALDEVPPGDYVILVDGKEQDHVQVGRSPVSRKIRVE